MTSKKEVQSWSLLDPGTKFSSPQKQISQIAFVRQFVLTKPQENAGFDNILDGENELEDRNQCHLQEVDGSLI